MLSSSLLVRDNMKSPPLSLLQPRASPRAEGKETVEIAYNGQQKVNAVEEISVEWPTIQRRSENAKEKDRVRDRPALRKGIPWNEGSPQDKVLQEKRTSQHSLPF